MIGYERIGQLIAVSAIKAGAISEFEVKPSTLGVSFENYVKSQVHLNLANNLYGRPLFYYVNSLRFLQTKNPKYRKDTESVLRFFYQDLAHFLIKNTSNVILELDVNVPLDLTVVSYDLAQIKRDALAILDNVSYDAISEFEFADIFDFAKSVDDAVAKMDSYALASVLLKESESKELHLLNFEGGTT